MTPLKRVLDFLLGVVMGTVLLPLIAAIALVVLLREGRPVLYGAKRMRAADEEFTLWKFRTMYHEEEDHGVSGGHKHGRITPVGRVLRRSRLDELPQLWNVIVGDISFVGPRPPDPHYVRMFPEIYGEVLKTRPGITGLATVAYHLTEERLLAACKTAAETEAVYIRRCIPRKARLDLIYAKNRNIPYDALLLFATVIHGLSLHPNHWVRSTIRFLARR